MPYCSRNPVPREDSTSICPLCMHMPGGPFHPQPLPFLSNTKGWLILPNPNLQAKSFPRSLESHIQLDFSIWMSSRSPYLAVTTDHIFFPPKSAFLCCGSGFHVSTQDRNIRISLDLFLSLTCLVHQPPNYVYPPLNSLFFSFMHLPSNVL